MPKADDYVDVSGAIAKVRERFPNSQFRVTIVEEWTPRGRKTKKSSAAISVFNNVVESAPTLGECVEAICEWRERAAL